MESFHAILAEHLKRYTFWNLQQLEQDMVLFMEKYNNQRLHASIAYLAPNDFEILWRQGLIQTIINEKQRKITFKLKIPRNTVKKYTGNKEPQGSLSLNLPESPQKAMKENLLKNRDEWRQHLKQHTV